MFALEKTNYLTSSFTARMTFTIDYRYLKTFHHSRHQNGEHLTSATTQLTLNVMETHVGPSGFVELTCISTIPAYLDDEEDRFADKRIQTISGKLKVTVLSCVLSSP
ncbi:hypothetical protein RUM43_002668 [Polyplax serrata]|uniref:Uncharacterized protein n=1 Tax=Polyplax serrata TaxID=468196 RepID=A0AAN8S501_POLSC